jgi:hypothetical protein
MKRTNPQHPPLCSSNSSLSSSREDEHRAPQSGPVTGIFVDPDQLSPDERIQEVASLLAAGFLRYWLKKAVDGGEKDLAILRTSSEVCPKPTSEGESL